MIVKAQNVTEVLSRFMLADGFKQIVDLKQSHGSWFVDARDGKEYLDLFAMFASMPVGYNHPTVLAAKDQLATAALNKPTNSDFYSTQLAEFVNTFFEIAVPDHFRYAFFIEGGGLAVENALKAAFDWKVRKNFVKNGSAREVGSKVIHFQQCFHGRTGYTLSLTNTADPRKTDYFPKFDWPRIVNPKLTFPLNEENLKNVVTDEEEALSQINNAIDSYGDDIAALIIEPIQGEGGDNHFRKEFLQELRDLCDNNEILLIFDEIQSGMGLTGKMWAWENHQVKPDLMCFGKKSQVCGFVSSDRIDEVTNNVFAESSRINSTWGGNLTDMVRLTIYLEIIRKESLVENAKSTGEYLLNKLVSLQNDYPTFVKNSRGLGLMCAFDLPSEKLRDQTVSKTLENGVIVMGTGTHGIRFRPHLIVSKDEIDYGIAAVRKSLDTI